MPVAPCHNRPQSVLERLAAAPFGSAAAEISGAKAGGSATFNVVLLLPQEIARVGLPILGAALSEPLLGVVDTACIGRTGARFEAPSSPALSTPPIALLALSHSPRPASAHPHRRLQRRPSCARGHLRLLPVPLKLSRVPRHQHNQLRRRLHRSQGAHSVAFFYGNPPQRRQQRFSYDAQNRP